MPGAHDTLFTFDSLFLDESNNHRNTHEEEEGKESCPYSSTIREVVEGLPYPQEPVNGVSTSSLAASFLHSQGQVENGEAELVAEEQEEADVPPRESRSQGAVARTPTTPPSPREGQHEEGWLEPLLLSQSQHCYLQYSLFIVRFFHNLV